MEENNQKHWSVRESLSFQRQVSETMRLGILLALSGGLMDAYSYLFRGEVFANAQTGNILLCSVALSQGEWGVAVQYAEVLSRSFALTAFVADRDRILAAAGSGKRDLADRSVSQPLEKVMESRKPYLSEGDPEHVLLPCEGSLRPLLCAWPIIAAGDVTGAVGLLAEDRTQQPDPAQQKAVAVAAAFLAKQMEE
mgnify:FL=1